MIHKQTVEPGPIGGFCPLGIASCLDAATESDERFCTRDECMTSRVEDRDVLVKKILSRAVQWMSLAHASGGKFEGRPHRLTDFDVAGGSLVKENYHKNGYD